MTNAHPTMTTEVERALSAPLPAIEGGFFFDSHGALWVSCGPDERGAVAFGPTGVARVVLCGAYAVLNSAGLVEHPNDDDGGVPVVPAASIARAPWLLALAVASEDDLRADLARSLEAVAQLAAQLELERELAPGCV